MSKASKLLAHQMPVVRKKSTGGETPVRREPPIDPNLFKRCIMQLDEGVLLANQTASSAWYRWVQDTSDLLREIREPK